jgi:hypothetical protein
VQGSADRWVVTHGRPDARHVVRTPDGPRLVGWRRLAVAPRERDLADALGSAEGTEPWFAYLEAGGPAEPLSPDTLEVFALQRTLSGVADAAARLSRPHGDTEDERNWFAGLERELGRLVALVDGPA